MWMSFGLVDPLLSWSSECEIQMFTLTKPLSDLSLLFALSCSSSKVNVKTK